jgi:beta-lactamase regulating signal transducer with metallopeptidase domain
MDNLWRVLAFATASLHWFNPFAWIFLRIALSDLELFCDERVLNQMGHEERRAYARALVDGAQTKQERTVFASAFGGARIRVRVERILDYRRLSRLSAVCAALLVAAIAWVLLTNAK